jgi:hypothetical protein
MSKSKEMTATEAIKKVKSFEKVGDLRKFAKGDTRKTVLDAVDTRTEKIKSQKSTTTQKASKKKDTPRR